MVKSPINSWLGSGCWRGLFQWLVFCIWCNSRYVYIVHWSEILFWFVLYIVLHEWIGSLYLGVLLLIAAVLTVNKRTNSVPQRKDAGSGNAFWQRKPRCEWLQYGVKPGIPNMATKRCSGNTHSNSRRTPEGIESHRKIYRAESGSGELAQLWP